MFSVNMEEAKEPVSSYKSFNEFFTRELKPELRPIHPNPRVFVSPVDSTVLDYGELDARKLFIKGFSYSLEELVGEPFYQKAFHNGQFLLLYLSPPNYHRIHLPCDSKLLALEYHRGTAYPVNSLGIRWIEKLFSKNERLTSFFESSFGLFALIKIAALNVSQIQTNYPYSWNKKQMRQNSRLYHDFSDPILLQKGQEIACFRMGSSVLILFQEKKEKKEKKIQLTVEFGEKTRVGEQIAIKLPEEKRKDPDSKQSIFTS